MLPAKDIVVDFGNGKRHSMVAYDDSLFMDTGLLMRDLRGYLDRVGTIDPSIKVHFENRKIMILKKWTNRLFLIVQA